MKQTIVAVEIFKLILTIILGWLLWVIIFAFMPGESVDENEFFPGATATLGIATGIVISLGTKYNTVQKAYQSTQSAYSNIKIYEEKNERLLDKANRVAEKYMTYEERIQKDRTEKRVNTNICTSKQFQIELENYPNLKANEGIMELLTQIRECENSLMQSKIVYNTRAEEYNTLIHIFPNNILKIIFKFKDMEFYDKGTEDEISDEELGIK